MHGASFLLFWFKGQSEWFVREWVLDPHLHVLGPLFFAAVVAWLWWWDDSCGAVVVVVG